ncbi:MAG: hypothetical protein NPIRA03_31760 [Nitrospirales bacterium]|nr:MAG: hypothetical protein NPIRA03_31760 [Nitrospirales bacterium]
MNKFALNCKAFWSLREVTDLNEINKAIMLVIPIVLAATVGISAIANLQKKA